MSLPTLELGRNSLGYEAFVTDERELVTNEVLLQTAVDLRRAETFKEQREALASFVICVGALTETVLPSGDQTQGRLTLGSSLLILKVEEGILTPNVEEVSAVIEGLVPRQKAKLDYAKDTGFVVIDLASRNPASWTIEDGELPIIGADITEEARVANRVADMVIWEASVALTDMGHGVGGELGLYKSVVPQPAF